MKEKMSERYSISRCVAAHSLYLCKYQHYSSEAGWCDDTLWVVLFLLFSKHLDLAAARIRYIIRVRNVKGGGSSESGSKNWIAKFNREYLKIFKIKLNKINFPNIFKNSKYPVLLGPRRSHIEDAKSVKRWRLKVLFNPISILSWHVERLMLHNQSQLGESKLLREGIGGM